MLLSFCNILDLSQILSNLATIFGCIISVFVFFVGLETFFQNSEDSRLDRLHSVFDEYLVMRLTLRKKGKNGDYFSRVISMKLYAMEEIYYYISRKPSKWWKIRRFIMGRKFFERRSGEMKAWEATIVSHLHDDKKRTLKNLNHFRQCYGEEFYKFAVLTLSK